MATVLDIGLLKGFSVIFPFLLIFLIVYAVLDKIGTGVFKNNAINATIALVLAFMGVLSPIVRNVVSEMAPWFVLLVVAIVFGLFVIMSLGPTESDVLGVLKNREFHWVIKLFIVMIALIAFGTTAKVVSERMGGFPGPAEGVAEEGVPGAAAVPGSSSFWNTLFHPKVLGLGAILLVAVFTIQRMADKPGG